MHTSAQDSDKRTSKVVAPQPDYFYLPKKEARIIAQKIALRQPILLSGPPGSGKSMLCELLARSVLKRDPEIMNFHSELAKDDIWGTWTLENGNTRFNYSPLLHAMTQSLPVILNEIDAAPPDSLFPLFGVLDQREITIPFLTDPESGGPLKINPWAARSSFTVLATANTLGRGDTSGLFRGTRVLNEAFLDRFDVIRIGYPPKEAEVGVLTKKTGINPLLAGQIVEIANLARNAQTAGATQVTFSIRKALRCANAITAMGLSFEQAYCLAALECARPEDRQALAEIYQRVTGRSVDPNCLH